MRIAIAQVNPTVGDLRGNRRLVEEAAAKAEQAGADMVVLPELVLTGYPPMDLLERDGFVRDQLRELDALAAASRGVAIVLGATLPVEDELRPRHLVNAAVLLAEGRQLAARAKSLLPSYDVFDEQRYFRRSERREPVSFGERSLGLTVCEDAWVEELGYSIDATGELAAAGAELVLNLSASPWHVDKAPARRAMITALAARHCVPLVFVNQVGGNDELVFDGASFACDARGRILAQLPSFESAFAVVDMADTSPPLETVCDPTRVEQLEAGLVLGIRDYFRKQGLPPGAVVGLSGGIDSAVTAHLAVRALGADRVLGIAMPGPYSSDHSIGDAEEAGRLLGIEVRQAPIGPVYDAYRKLFANLFGERDDYGLAQQNIQARIRGALLMAVSNAEGRLVLATGNKSEFSVGYCTLYGDMVGGLAVLGDVYKRDVYAIARHANAEQMRIPAGSIEKPPSAELAPDQLDSDDLPPYDVLDEILEQAVEGRLTAASIEAPAGVSAKVVRDVLARVDRNEYKRRQAPLVLRTSTKAFGSGRRLPIVHRYPSDS
jgi:NAD+ synthetase